MALASWGLSHSAAPGRAMTTISRTGSAALCLRNDSLTTRLIRLRWTADLETFFETARPSRADDPGAGVAITVKQALPERRPDLNTRVNCSGDSKRCARVKACGCGGASGSLLTAIFAQRGLDGEPGAALGAPAGQHQPTVLGGHASAETMGPFPAQITRLIGAFHRTDSVREMRAAGPTWRLPKRREIVRGAR